MKTYKECNVVENKCELLCEKYDDLLDKHDNSSVILNSPPRKMSTYLCALISQREFLLQSSKPPSEEGDAYKLICLFRN